MTDRKNTDLVLAEVQQEPYARHFSADEIEEALKSAMNVFADFEQIFVVGFSGVILRPKGAGSLQRPANFAKELLPGFLYAHRYFGDVLPIDLRQKLTNQRQTHDTLFELICMGLFQQNHEVRYEPKLIDGKVPDLMLVLNREYEVFVECKSQSALLSKHMQLFGDAAIQIHSVLDLKESTFVRSAWMQGLRVEVRLSQSPSSADIRELRETIDNHDFSSDVSQLQFGKAISLSLIARDEPYDPTLASPITVMQVATTQTQAHHKNVHVAVYPWSRLESIQRKSQRRLLTSARHKLKSIPESAYGLICIQTVSSKKFTPDVHTLLKQDEFKNIPIVWQNPHSESKLIYRNDALWLRDAIFDGMLKRVNESRNEEQDN